MVKKSLYWYSVQVGWYVDLFQIGPRSFTMEAKAILAVVRLPADCQVVHFMQNRLKPTADFFSITLAHQAEWICKPQTSPNHKIQNLFTKFPL